MSIGRYLKDKWYYIAIWGVIGAFLFGNLIMFRCSSYLIFLTVIGIFCGMSIPLVIEYGKKRSFYLAMNQCMNSLDKKYLICELLPKPTFAEGEIVYEGLTAINKNMMDELMMYKQMIKEHKEYIDLWVHEVKTPVTNVMLIADNNKNEVTDSIREEMEKIEDYIEQTLYYSKTDMVEKDYKIVRQPLDEIIKTAVKNNKKALIANGIKVELGDLHTMVVTDAKWLVFVLNQIITNSVKYRRKDHPTLSFSMSKQKQSVTLLITDNGIGIKEEEVGKVLEKGFVGTNGRKKEATTGMGLYICKKLLGKMHHGIVVMSEEGAYTTIAITFPETSFYFNS